MRITFGLAARDDLEHISAWIAKDSPRAALEMIARIEESVNRLATPALSNMGHPGYVHGTLELVVRPYIIVYKVFKQRSEIVILAVVHGARER